MPGRGPNNFNRPTDIAFLPDGTFFVADGYAGVRVAKFDKNGKFLTTWGENGTSNSQFGIVSGVAVNSEGQIYVADSGNNRLLRFPPVP